MTDTTGHIARPRDRQEETFRYERKFVLESQSLADFHLAVKLHPAMFRPAYPPRYVNNLYFDTRDRSSFFDNVEGMPNRTKMRVRWYGDVQGETKRPFLEFKIKRGVVGTKRRFDLPPFTLTEHDAASPIVSALTAAELPPSIVMQLPHVEPTLLNRYHREYFESARGFRLTIDSSLQSCDPERAFHRPERRPEMVVELKYDPDLEYEARTLLSHFGLRVMKNSKYVTGLG